MRLSTALSLTASAVLAASTLGCKTFSTASELRDDQNAGDASADPGALVKVTTSSRVGVLLDEIPEPLRQQEAQALLAKGQDFWIARAKRQLALTTYRLVFRGNYYPNQNKMSLPLPPASTFNFEVSQPKQDTIDGHQYVVVDYKLTAMILATAKSPGESEPALGRIGGTWSEPMVFPADPELLVQRTDFACMDESEFPPNSVDTEDTEFFYDHECGVEAQLSPTGCHRSHLVQQSCVDALQAKVGAVKTAINYQRIPYDKRTADAARVDQLTNDNGSDLQVIADELKVNRVIYRYIPQDSCAIVEGCVEGGGWRRLLQFNASEKDTGTLPVHIGDVDYFVTNLVTGAKPAIDHHIFEYSPCHNHYHFSHYGVASYEGASNKGRKRAFCLESVQRYSNNEASPINTPYASCSYQGIAPGWGDQYNAGLECQWVDVTMVDTSRGPVTNSLSFRSNPDGFLCEGQPVLDETGHPVFEPTSFRTAKNEPVDRPKCNFKGSWEQNNVGTTPATVPQAGGGLVTSPCDRGQIGPLRNCGFSYTNAVQQCQPGTPVTLQCNVQGGMDHIVRVCETSTALGVGVACTLADALANQATVNGNATVQFTCPAGRDQVEQGGHYALYTGAMLPDAPAAPVSCRPAP